LRRQAAHLFIELGDAFAQLRALPRPCRPSRFEQFLLPGERRGHRWIVAPAGQLRGKHDGISVVALG
jgi:hypothetical protein